MREARTESRFRMDNLQDSSLNHMGGERGKEVKMASSSIAVHSGCYLRFLVKSKVGLESFEINTYK